MDLARDLARIAHQEAQLQLARVDADVAWELGCALRNDAISLGKPIAIEVSLAGARLFYCALPGATPNNADWIRRKQNVVLRFHKSSYAVGLDCRQHGATLEQRSGAPFADFAAVGGGFPIRLRGAPSVLGAVTVSGLAERDDHELIVRVLARHLEIDETTVALATSA